MAGSRRAVGAAVVVASGAGAAARAYISDGTLWTSPAVATTRSRTWLSVQHDVPPNARAYQEGVMLTGPVGSTFVLGEFESAPSSALLPDHSFSVPVRQTIMALASISPYVGVKFTFPKDGKFDVNLGQASNLAITGGVTALIGDLEGQSSSFPAMFSVSSPSSPTIFGPVLHQVLDATGHGGDPRYYALASGNWPVRGNHLQMYGGPGETWDFVSWDIQGFLLLAGP